MSAAKNWLRRRHFFTHDQLNNPHWPHPRPARDPRLLAMYAAIMTSSVIQAVDGVAPGSVQGLNDFDSASIVAFSVLAVSGCVLIAYAAFAESQYWSFVCELIGCLAVALTFGIYLWGIRAVPNYWATNGAWWALAIVCGHLVRAGVVGRRFW
jgi:hypothetical protein